MAILTCYPERQLADAQGSTPLTREPTQPSQLLQSTSATDEGASPSGAVATPSSARSAAVSDTVKG